MKNKNHIVPLPANLLIPLSFGQWQKVSTPEKWALKLVSSKHSFVKPDAQFIFPIPYQ
jgi:hypothetical protein